MYQPEEKRILIKASSENLELICTIEAEIAEQEPIYSSGHFNALRDELKEHKSSELERQRILMDPNSQTCFVLGMENCIIERKMSLQHRLRFMLETRRTRTEVARLQKKIEYRQLKSSIGRFIVVESEDSNLNSARLELTRLQNHHGLFDEVERLQKVVEGKDSKFQEILEAERIQMKKNCESDVQKSNDEISRLQKALEDKEAENQRLLKDSGTEKAQMKASLQKSLEDVTDLQKTLEENNSEILNMKRRLENSDFSRFLMKTEIQKFQDEVSRLQKVLEDKDDKNLNLQRLLKNSDAEKDQRSPVNQESGFQKDSEIKELREELGRLYMENRSLKAEQPVGTKPEKTTQNVLVNPEQSASHETEQPIIHIPRSLPNTDERTPKDFQIKNLIQANRQLSVQQSDYHKTTSQEDDDIDVMTEDKDEQSATVTYEMNALKTENKELKTKFEMINL